MSDYEDALTDDELRWIRALKRLAAKRPPTLGAWGGNGNLSIIALNESGGLLHGGGWGETVVVVTDVDIPAGGGDPDWACIEDVDRPWVRDALREGQADD